MSGKRYLLMPHHHEHLTRIGVPKLRLPHVDAHTDEYEAAYAAWKRTHPNADHDFLHTKALGHCAWGAHAEASAEKSVVHHETKAAKWERRVTIVLLLLLLMTFASVRAHCQFSKINSIDLRNNDNSAQGFVTFPFIFKAGANCSWTPSGSTFTFNCAGGAATGYQTLQNATVAITQRTIINWTAGIVCADNVPSTRSDCALANVAAVSHKFFNSVVSGALVLAQPDYGDLTGVPATFAPTAHSLLSASHGDTTAATAVRGDGIFAIGATPTWQRLAHSAATGGYFKWNGTDIVGSTGAAGGTGTCTNQFVSAENADAAPTCTTATLASAQFANQGTTTTVLHGNAAGNPAFGAIVQGDVTSGYVDQATTQATIAGNKTFTGTTTLWNTSFKGPLPRYDASSVNGIVGNWNGSTGTDDTTAFQALVTTACAASPAGGIIFIPNGEAIRLTVAITIPCQISFEGDIANGGAFGAGSFLVDDRAAPAATAGLLNWTGNNFLTVGIGGGIQHLVIWRATTRTAGAAISLTATDCNHRPGHMYFDDVRVTGDGTYNYAFYVDGTLCATSGIQGIRDVTLIDFQPFQTTSAAMLLKNAVHFYWYGATTSPTGGGNADITVDGGGTTLTNSTDVLLSGSISGSLNLINADRVRCAGCYVSGNITSTVATTNSFFDGQVDNSTPGVTSGFGYVAYDSVATAAQSGTRVFALRSQTWLGSGTALPSNVLTGDVFANQDFVLAKGADGAMRIRRNNGSSTNTNEAHIGSDGNVHWNYDFSTGFSTDVPIYPVAAGGTTLGKLANPFSSLFIGGAATNNIQVTGTATGSRVATFPDNTGTVAETNINNNFSAEQTFATTTSSVAPTQIPTQLTAPSAAPTLTCSNTGGSLAAATHFFKIAFNNTTAGVTTVSPEASCATTGTTGSVVVTAPTLPTNATGYTVYDSNTTNTELTQAASGACVNISANCTVTTLAAGAAMPSANNASACPTSHTALFGEEYCLSSDGTTANDIEAHTPAPGTAGAILTYDSGGTNAITDTVNGTVTSYTNRRPLAAGTGVQFGVNASNVITQNFSGDAAHVVSQTAKTAAVTTFTVCAATAGTACGQVGQYRISYNFWGSGTACSAVTAGSVGLNLTWTDENAVTHTTVSMPMAFDQKSAAAGILFNFNTALGTEGASGSYVISTNGTIIQAATTYTACTTGTGTYNLRMTVEQLQ